MSVFAKLRSFAKGFLTVHYGSCGGDPIAWEKDLIRRREEEAAREAAGRNTWADRGDPEGSRYRIERMEAGELSPAPPPPVD